MYKSIFLFFSIFCFFACNKKKEETAQYPYKIKVSEDRKVIAIDDTVGYFSLRSGTYKDVDTSFFYYIHDNTVLIIDMEKQKVLRKIRIPNSGPNAIPDFSSLCFLSPNSVIAGGSLVQKLYFCSVKDNFSVEKVFDYQHLSDSITVLNFGIQGELVFKISDFLYFVTASPYISIQFWDARSRFKQFQQKSFFAARYSLKNNDLQVLQTLPPENYFADGFQILENAVSVAKRKDKFYYNFEASHQIGVTDEKHKKINYYNVKSQFVTLQGMPLSDIKANMKFSAERGAYQNLIYDEYRDIFYRIAQVNDEMREDENPGDLFQSPLRFSVMLLSPDLEVLAEELLPRGKFVPSNFFVDKKGLWLSENHPLNKSVNEDSLRFVCLKLEKR
jgi:hypothetical protein